MALINKFISDGKLYNKNDFQLKIVQFYIYKLEKINMLYYGQKMKI